MKNPEKSQEQIDAETERKTAQANKIKSKVNVGDTLTIHMRHWFLAQDEKVTVSRRVIDCASLSGLMVEVRTQAGKKHNLDSQWFSELQLSTINS